MGRDPIAAGCPVGGVNLGLEDEVQSPDVVIALAVAFPVELLQGFIALELADDSVSVEDNTQPSTHPLPASCFSWSEAQFVPRETAVAFARQCHCLGARLRTQAASTVV